MGQLDIDPELMDPDSEGNQLDARLKIHEDAAIIENHQPALSMRLNWTRCSLTGTSIQ